MRQFWWRLSDFLRGWRTWVADACGVQRPRVKEACFTQTPWVCIYYLRDDAAADRRWGWSVAELECLICGHRERVRYRLPARRDPVWHEPALGQDGLPAQMRVLLRFQIDHFHPDRQAVPLLWAKPLANLTAVGPGRCGPRTPEDRELVLAELREHLVRLNRRCADCDKLLDPWDGFDTADNRGYVTLCDRCCHQPFPRHGQPR